MADSPPIERPRPYTDTPTLRKAYRRGKAAAEDERPVPRSIIDGCRDAHYAWLDGYMDGVGLHP